MSKTRDELKRELKKAQQNQRRLEAEIERLTESYYNMAVYATRHRLARKELEEKCKELRKLLLKKKRNE